MCSFLGFALWREGLEYPDNIGNLPMAEITREQFEQRFYHRALAGRTHDGLRNYTHQLDGYRDGGSQADDGKEAYEAMIAPVFALTLSLLGALVHIAKSALLGVQLKSGWRFRSPLFKACATVAVVLLVLALGRTFISTSLTSHPTYQAWTGTAGEQGSGTLMLDTMIRMQTLAYPVFKVPLSMMGYVAAAAKDWKRQAPAVQ
ncbi:MULTISPECIES: hypothetical protein [Pseudomonas]|uniref:hypothetical protein n=1 Tax=Pseudomonas TaxID=286 RepID=UPI0015B8C413|nr:hypothetical protein [Pseudomonas hunanensis]NWL08613.1 hypothetical protein [Pseudomonas hunanensis]